MIAQYGKVPTVNAEKNEGIAMDDKERKHLEQLRQIQVRRLQALEQQAATYGIDTKPEITIQIEDLRNNISDITNKLERADPSTPSPRNDLIVTTLSTSDRDSHTPGRPSGDIEFEQPHGTMSPNSIFYIERQSDIDCWNLLHTGRAVTIYVQAPRQMGKSSLMMRMTNRIKQEYSLPTAFIDFEKFTEQQFEQEEDFLIELCLMIGEKLHISEAIDNYWTNRRRSNIVRCSRYISEHIISRINSPFILAMDEVERILSKPLRNNFFGMLRSWHNDRAIDDNFSKMTLFLSSSTEPHLFIDNINQSPFNVAEILLLRDFNPLEVRDLNTRYHSPLNDSEVGELIDLLDGHPFLTRRSLYLFANGRVDFRTLHSTATSDNGPFSEHLRRYWQLILENPELKASILQICRYQTHPEDRFYYRLKGAGLIKRVGPQVQMRNTLYHQYFTERLNG